MSIDMSIAVVENLTDHPDGAGWYYHDEEYPEEGVCGPFGTVDDVLNHIDSCEYNLLHVTIKPRTIAERAD